MGFYAYILARPNGVPFYVGKGKGRRWTYGGNAWAKRVARKVQANGGKVNVVIFRAMSEKEAFRMEVDLIAAYGRSELGAGVLCNMTDGGEGLSGVVFSDETRAKISAALSGENNPMFGRRGQGNPLHGKSPSAEVRAKMSAWQIGRKLSPETRAKISAAGVGRKLNPKQKAALAAANAGNKRWLGRKHKAESKAKISAAVSGERHGMYGKSHTAEARRKISEGLMGRPCSEETRAKMSASRKAYFARLKAAGK